MPNEDPGSKVDEQRYPPVGAADPAAGNAGPGHEDVARLAFSHWEARGRGDGSPDEDWFKAENELRARATPAA
jgi:hypothetical protein